MPAGREQSVSGLGGGLGTGRGVGSVSQQEKLLQENILVGVKVVSFTSGILL